MITTLKTYLISNKFRYDEKGQLDVVRKLFQFLFLTDLSRTNV